MENIAILQSKQFIKNGVAFLKPLDYLNPIIDIIGSDNIAIEGSHLNEVGEDDVHLKSYGRISLIKSFEIDEEINYSLGYIYALNVGKPFLKVFSGVNVKACTNLCIFNANNITKFDILTNGEGAAERMREYFLNVNEQINKAKVVIFEMKNTFLTTEEVKKCLGQLLMNFSNTKNIAGTTCIVNAAKLITDNNSKYYFENNTSCWNLYNALTDNYRDTTHIIDQPEKVLSLFNEMIKFKDIKQVQSILSLN